ncbi:hypothetical protein F4804DRAFT_334603 [Jackrogersella minutella]|nr:hypothetical protein F4804DRAFT_334603 [Jackrogersella minutella]
MLFVIRRQRPESTTGYLLTSLNHKDDIGPDTMNIAKENLPVALAMAGFAGDSWYVGAEITVSLFRRGFYFWACTIGGCGFTIDLGLCCIGVTTIPVTGLGP